MQIWCKMIKNFKNIKQNKDQIMTIWYEIALKLYRGLFNQIVHTCILLFA